MIRRQIQSPIEKAYYLWICPNCLVWLGDENHTGVCREREREREDTQMYEVSPIQSQKNVLHAT